MDDLNVFRTFVAAAEAHSFALAADRLGLTRSAVAKAVARLETRTGTRLFQRTTRAMVLTEEGRILCEQCAKTLAELDGALMDMAGRLGELRGVLRMTVPDSYGRSHLLPVLVQFLKAWPGIEADVNFSDRSSNIVADGYDLAVRIGASDLDDELVSRVVARHRVSLYASPTYLAEHGEPTTVEQLSEHVCLRFSQYGRPLPLQLRDEHGKPIALELNGRLRFDSGEALRDAASAGLGIVQLPDFVVEGQLDSGDLKRILEAHEPEPTPIVAIYPSRRLLPPKVRLFVDALVTGLAAERTTDSDVCV
ncbi:LysR substrate-binding domain-containing protein [Bordetella muralis]|uniref:LysR family transcriptional regulator n=1 Tax=Bordetella muralis TaxID=1649130 RepID=UPI0039EEEAF9